MNTSQLRLLMIALTASLAIWAHATTSFGSNTGSVNLLAMKWDGSRVALAADGPNRLDTVDVDLGIGSLPHPGNRDPSVDSASR